MLQKLKKMYPSLIQYSSAKKSYYHWFSTEDDEVFGIPKEEILTDKELQLLHTLFNRFIPSIPDRNPLEQLWHERIFGTNNIPISNPFRFIFFSIQNMQIDHGEFKEAFTTLFEKSIPVLWQNESEGILIEEIDLTTEKIQFDSIINILMADLSVNINFFVGPILSDCECLKAEFENLIEMGKEVFQIANDKVIHFIEAMPYLILNALPTETKNKLSKEILRNFIDDAEMIETLENYFRYNLNISETAKNMYMHRNSLQYRLDKFVKETGINIQHFNEAISVKLALLAKDTHRF